MDRRKRSARNFFILCLASILLVIGIFWQAKKEVRMMEQERAIRPIIEESVKENDEIMDPDTPSKSRIIFIRLLFAFFRGKLYTILVIINEFK